MLVSFVLIGLGAYGGGLVAIPLIQHEIVTGRHWLTFDEMARLLAIAQMTPGPIAVNAATFVGFCVAGVVGSAVATLAVVAPSLSILFWLAPGVEKVQQNRHVQSIRQGIQLGVLSLILFATWSYGTAAIRGGPDLALALGAFAALIALEGKLHPVFVILACGVLGLIVY